MTEQGSGGPYEPTTEDINHLPPHAHVIIEPSEVDKVNAARRQAAAEGRRLFDGLEQAAADQMDRDSETGQLTDEPSLASTIHRFIANEARALSARINPDQTQPNPIALAPEAQIQKKLAEFYKNFGKRQRPVIDKATYQHRKDYVDASMAIADEWSRRYPEVAMLQNLRRQLSVKGETEAVDACEALLAAYGARFASLNKAANTAASAVILPKPPSR